MKGSCYQLLATADQLKAELHPDFDPSRLRGRRGTAEERRETAADAADSGDSSALEAILGEVRAEVRELEGRVSSLLDVDGA